MTVFIDPVFAFLTRVAVSVMSGLGLNVTMPELQPDAFPFWDSCMMVLSIAAMILMTRKYVENWLLWVVINVISVVIFARQGVYAMSLEYMLLTVIALNGSRMWINSARERGSRAFPNGDARVSGRTAPRSGDSLARYRADTPSGWWSAQLLGGGTWVDIKVHHFFPYAQLCIESHCGIVTVICLHVDHISTKRVGLMLEEIDERGGNALPPVLAGDCEIIDMISLRACSNFGRT